MCDVTEGSTHNSDNQKHIYENGIILTLLLMQHCVKNCFKMHNRRCIKHDESSAHCFLKLTQCKYYKES